MRDGARSANHFRKSSAHSVFFARGDELLLVERVSVGLGRGEETRSHHDPIRPERKGGDEAARIGDPTSCEDDSWRDRVDHTGDERHGRDCAGTVTASLDPLGYDDIRASARSPNGVSHRAHLHYDRNSGLMRGLDERRRVAPEQRQRCNPLLKADADSLLVREVQDKTHPERAVRQCAQASNLLP